MLLKKICMLICSLLLGSLCLIHTPAVQAVGITNYAPLVQADYWVKQNKQGERLLMDPVEVQRVNRKIAMYNNTVVELAAYPQQIAGSELQERLQNYDVLGETLYLNGNRVSDNYRNILRQQTNVEAVPEMVNVAYGITTDRTNVRTLPTGQPLFFYGTDHEFDALQETTLDPAEPVLVLHKSANGYFYYVQSRNYAGWVTVFDVALTDRETWLDFVQPKKFLVVVGKEFSLKTDGRQVLYQQGSVLPVEGESATIYMVTAPTRTAEGRLQTQSLNVHKNTLKQQGLHEGYLPYTSNNILRVAFAFYGAPYGWGGLKQSVDCSSLIYNVYRTVGIYLPRNADEQENTFKLALEVLPEYKNAAERYKQITRLTPGSCLYMPGHAVLYLGAINGVPYGIHALGSYTEAGQRKPVMKVVVSDLSLRRASGKTLLEDVTAAVEYR